MEGLGVLVREGGSRSWASLLQHSSPRGNNMDLSFVEPLIVGDRKIAIYEDGDFLESEFYLKNAIVACIVGLRPAFKPLLSYIHERWRPKVVQEEDVLHYLSSYSQIEDLLLQVNFGVTNNIKTNWV
uniref:Protein argonaute 14 n=1 Tax=Anthurium amnicola TaxID=1678845 RepID=A0A1D1Y9Z2_9ARAE